MITFRIQNSDVSRIVDGAARAKAQAEHAVANQVMTDTRPFVPMRTGSLVNRTHIVDNNTVEYPGPYARYLYHGKVMVDPKTGKAGFLTKNGWRSRKGVTKVLTGRDLKISKAVNPKATAHWANASKQENMEKWARVAGEAYKHEFS